MTMYVNQLKLLWIGGLAASLWFLIMGANLIITDFGLSLYRRLPLCAVTMQQRVIIPNKHGENLVGLLHETGSREIVILCHGFVSNKVSDCLIALDFSVTLFNLFTLL